MITVILIIVYLVFHFVFSNGPSSSKAPAPTSSTVDNGHTTEARKAFNLTWLNVSFFVDNEDSHYLLNDISISSPVLDIET